MKILFKGVVLYIIVFILLFGLSYTVDTCFTQINNAGNMFQTGGQVNVSSEVTNNTAFLNNVFITFYSIVLISFPIFILIARRHDKQEELYG